MQATSRDKASEVSEKESAARADFAESLRKVRREERRDRADEEPALDAGSEEASRSEPADEARAGEKAEERESRSSAEEKSDDRPSDQTKVQERGEGSEEGQERSIRETGFVVLASQIGGTKPDETTAEDGSEHADEGTNLTNRPGVVQSKRAQGQHDTQTPANGASRKANQEVQPTERGVEQQVEARADTRSNANVEHKPASKAHEERHLQQADATNLQAQVTEAQAAAAKDRAAIRDEASQKVDRLARAEESRLTDAKAEADRAAPEREIKRESLDAKADWAFAGAGDGVSGVKRDGGRVPANAKAAGGVPAGASASQQSVRASSEAESRDLHAHGSSSGGSVDARAVQAGSGAAGDAGADANAFSRSGAGAEVLEKSVAGVRGSTSGAGEASPAKTLVAQAAPLQDGGKSGADASGGAPGARVIAAVVSRSGEPALEVFSGGGQKVGGRMAQTDAQFERMLAAQVERGVLAAMNSQSGSVTIRLHPAALGQLRVQVQMEKSGGVSAKFEASSSKAKDAISKGVGALRESLDERGIELTRVAVSIAGDADPGFVESGDGGNAQGRHGGSEQQANASGQRFGTRLAKGRIELSGKVDGGAVTARGRSSGEMLESLGAAASVRAHRPA